MQQKEENGRPDDKDDRLSRCYPHDDDEVKREGSAEIMDIMDIM
jgi:hypothetical protein